MANPKKPKVTELLNPDKAQHLAIRVAGGGNGKIQPEDMVFAELISRLQWVHNEINAARAKMGIDSPHQLPVGNSTNAIFEVINRLSPAQTRRLLTQGRILSAKLNLRGWDMTIWGVILTNQLVLFPATEKIVLHPPKSRPSRITNDNALHILLNSGVPSKKSLVIEIRERVSRNQVEEFIRKRKETIDSYLQVMPGIPKYKIEKRVLVIGQAVWLVKQEYPKFTWPETLKLLLEFSKSIRLPGLPDRGEDLRKIYESYLKYLTNVQ